MESCSTCEYLNKDKLIYNSIKKERFKYGCSIRRYTTNWLQNDEQLINSKCDDYFFARNATESCQNAENETECNNLINCKDEEKDTLKIENTKSDCIWEKGGHKIKCLMRSTDGQGYTVMAFNEEQFLGIVEEKDLKNEIVCIEYDEEVYRNDVYKYLEDFVNALKEQSKQADRKPIPKTGQLPGQIDLFNLELWEV